VGAIEERMHGMIAGEQPFSRRAIDRTGALRVLEGQPYKLELIGELP